ncbi:MAG: transglutaminase family protein [Planctomycetales bacterium]|nr:transglutaminase family protein [Planctomycetales bacterium]
MPEQPPADFLSACPVIDCDNPSIHAQAKKLVGGTELDTVARCFHFVRDGIKHSSDHRCNPVTCRASDVLHFRTGFCYAKSHLLCALLRACDIPAGLGYQRLSIAGDGAPFCLHGLVVVNLTEYGWFRIDPRGNCADVDAQFCPPAEKLAFQPVLPGEDDIAGVHATPLPAVVEVLNKYTTWEDVLAHLPDGGSSN